VWPLGSIPLHDHLGIKFNHNNLFYYHGVSKEQGWAIVRSQAKDSRRAMVEQSEFNEELSEQEGRLLL
jgi:hypothetical protein